MFLFLPKSDIVASLYSNNPGEQVLFSASNVTDAYAPSNDLQFQLPLSINDASAVDEHGQIYDQSTFLDKVFNYVSQYSDIY